MLIPVTSDFLLELLTEVGKYRALEDCETDLIEEIVRGESQTTEFCWTPEHDEMLEAAAKRKGICRLARDLGVSPGAAYLRMHRVRKRKSVRLQTMRAEG